MRTKRGVAIDGSSSVPGVCEAYVLADHVPRQVKPTPPELLYPVSIESGRPSPQLAPLVSTEVVHRHVTQVDLREDHRPASTSRLSLVIGLVDEDAEPLIPGTVEVDGAALLPGRLDLDTLFPRREAVVGIDTLDEEIRMTVVVAVLRQATGVVRETRRQHVRDESRHGGRPKHIVEALQPSAEQVAVDVEKEVVDILHRQVEVLGAQLVREPQFPVEASRGNVASIDRLHPLF